MSLDLLVPAAFVYTVLTIGVIAFQIALVCGAPWGHLTLGGKFTGALPTKVRAVPVVSAILLAVFTIIVLVRAGLIFPEYQATSRYAIWFPVGYTGLGIVMNSITSAKGRKGGKHRTKQNFTLENNELLHSHRVNAER
ncbi:MAG: hypothetical protein NTX15_02300 [Candidatus Kapabacteria bacterium]|nr:hypothetical protein [Candidatus Kapabacteria bacterium]